MTPERLQEIKDSVEGINPYAMEMPTFPFGLINELISAVEELQKVPALIQAIFEAGGSLWGLGFSVEEHEFYVSTVKNGQGSYIQSKSLVPMLEFILERTIKK